MTSIEKATIKNCKLLSKIGIASFMFSHGHSSPKKDLEDFILKNLSEERFLKAVTDQNNHFYTIVFNNKIVGYSLVIFNEENNYIKKKNSAYLSRIYLLEAYHGLGLGKNLFDFIKTLCIQNQQSGIWLKVWIENYRAITFYKKLGFQIIGESLYKISENHSNPNHIMYLEL